MTSQTVVNFDDQLKIYLSAINQGIDQLLPTSTTTPSRLHEAMRYSMQAGGKRLRPIILLATAAQLGGSKQNAMPAAIAVECIHTYSLIHDDLPCMDDDDLRRGRATCHKAFDEATALLAGDSLLTKAFLLLSLNYNDKTGLQLVRELSHAASSHRLIGGQMEDLLAEKIINITADKLEYIHVNKTAAMIEVSFVMGGILSNAEDAILEKLRTLGKHLGLAFQIIDDVLDATSPSTILGKTPGKDEKSNKCTYVKLYGLQGARVHAKSHTEKAVQKLEEIPGDRAFLSQLTNQLLARKY